MSDFLSRICYTVLTGLDSHDRSRLLLLVLHTGLRSTISIAYWAQITTSIAYWAQITTSSAYWTQITTSSAYQALINGLQLSEW